MLLNKIKLYFNSFTNGMSKWMGKSYTNRNAGTFSISFYAIE